MAFGTLLLRNRRNNREKTMREHPDFTPGRVLVIAVLAVVPISSAHAADASGRVDLSRATIVVRSGEPAAAEQRAATVLVEEIAARTGLQWNQSAEWPNEGPVIAITLAEAAPGWPHETPRRQGEDLPELAHLPQQGLLNPRFQRHRLP